MDAAVHTGLTSLTDELFPFLRDAMVGIVQTVTADGNAIMLIPVGIMVVGAAIGLASRLIGR